MCFIKKYVQWFYTGIDADVLVTYFLHGLTEVNIFQKLNWNYVMLIILSPSSGQMMKIIDYL